MGVGLVVTVAALALAKDSLIVAFTAQGLADFPLAQISVLLFAGTIVLIFLWIKATSGEYQILRDNFPKFIPPIPRSSFPIIIGLGILLGSLCYFSDRIVVYSAIFACFNLFVIWGIWVRDAKIKVALDRAREKAPAEHKRRKTWIVIEKYYLERPHVQLAVTQLFFCFVALVLGLSGELLARQPVTTQLLTAGYSVMVLNIVIPEIVYGNWRRKRDHALGEDYA